MGGMGRIGTQWVRQTNAGEKEFDDDDGGVFLLLDDHNDDDDGMNEWGALANGDKKTAASPLVFFFFSFLSFFSFSLSPLVCLSLSVFVGDGISQETNQPCMMVAVYNGIALNITPFVPKNSVQFLKWVLSQKKVQFFKIKLNF